MQSWAAAWGLNGLFAMAVLYLFAFFADANKKVLHWALAVFLILAMVGTFPINMCR